MKILDLFFKKTKRDRFMTLRIIYDKLISTFEDKVVGLIDIDKDNLVVNGISVIDISSAGLFISGHPVKYLSEDFVFTSVKDPIPLWGFHTWILMEELIDLVDKLSYENSQIKLKSA